MVQEQTNEQHQYHVYRILRAIWPEAPTYLLDHAMFHDLGEVVAGDPPYPSKRNNPDYKAAHERIETAAWLSMCLPWGLPPPRELSPEEVGAFKLAEWIEWMEKSIQEIKMGNQYFNLVYDRTLTIFWDNVEDGPALPRVREAAKRYMEKRIHHEHFRSV
jgi:5'-deoxynucleotidase YfbR-like HD superfamily hydrolase